MPCTKKKGYRIAFFAQFPAAVVVVLSAAGTSTSLITGAEWRHSSLPRCRPACCDRARRTCRISASTSIRPIRTLSTSVCPRITPTYVYTRSLLHFFIFYILYYIYSAMVCVVGLYARGGDMCWLAVRLVCSAGCPRVYFICRVCMRAIEVGNVEDVVRVAVLITWLYEDWVGRSDNWLQLEVVFFNVV